MSDPVALTDEYVYRIAPDGKSAQAGLDLVRRGAFREPRRSDDGKRLEAKCQGSERLPYTVRIDLSDPTYPQLGCNCSSYKQPCKHALGLLFLAVRSPESFAGGPPAAGAPKRPGTTLMAGAVPRETPGEGERTPADVGEALFQAILAEPEDDATRLVYADWLDEHGGEKGQARAEFIRVQVELSKAAEGDPRVKKLRAREKALWAAHREEWLKSLPAHLRKRYVRFGRGFFEELNWPARSWAKHGAKLFGENPVYRVRLPDQVNRHEVGDLVVLPYLERVRVLSLEGCELYEPMKTLQILFGTPFLSGLRRLVLRDCDISSRELGVLTASPLLGRLRELDLADNDIGPKGAQLLAESPATVNLRQLDLTNNPLGDGGAKSLALSPHLGGLTRLDLHGVTLGEGAKAALRERFGERALFD